MSPEQLAAEITARIARYRDAVGDAVEDAASDVRLAEQAVTHVQTGRLRESETVFGAYEAGDVIAATITPVDVPYAELEAARGPEHNFAERGLQASQAHLDTLRRNLERLFVQAIEG